MPLTKTSRHQVGTKLKVIERNKIELVIHENRMVCACVHTLIIALRTVSINIF